MKEKIMTPLLDEKNMTPTKIVTPMPVNMDTPLAAQFRRPTHEKSENIND